MTITHSKSATTFTGESISFYRLVVLKHAVSLELSGMKVRCGPVVWKQVANEFHIKPCSKQAVYNWLCAKVEDERVLQKHEHVLDHPTYPVPCQVCRDGTRMPKGYGNCPACGRQPHPVKS